MGMLRSFGSIGVVAALLAAVVAMPAGAKDVPYVPTPQAVVDAMLDMAKVKSTDTIIDLGSGDGRIVITAAQKFGAKGFGVDIDPERVAESKENARAAGVSAMVDFRQADLFKTDISKADVLTMYLLPQVNLRLRPVILDTLKPGTRVVSHAFDMGDWEPDQRRDVEGKQIFHWVVPAKVGGTWRVTEGGRTQTVTLTQTYQMLAGAGEGGTTAKGRVDGTTVTLTMPGADGRPRTLTGKVDGGRIAGTADGKPWTAERVGG